MDMSALVALFTIFLGLVGLLAVIGECQKRRHRRSSSVPGSSDGGNDLLEQVKTWLTGHQHNLPTTQQIVDLLSDSLHKFSSQVSCDQVCDVVQFSSAVTMSIGVERDDIDCSK